MKSVAAALLLAAAPLFAAQHIVDNTTFNTIVAELSGERGAGSPAGDPPPERRRHVEAAFGPQSLTIAPIDAEALRDLSSEDTKWLEEQRSRYDNLDVVLFEAINFMNGHRPANEIADLLTMEFTDAFTPAWVDRLSSVLASIKLVAMPAVR
jgi:hypothetical protein